METPNTVRLLSPSKVVIIVDTTFFNRHEGLTILRSYTTKQNLAWIFVRSEQKESYRYLRNEIERKGYIIIATVIDGKYGLKDIFLDVPVQVCQFHMKMISRRYLTQNPRLKAAQELKILTSKLTRISESKFKKDFTNWENKWSEFLKEKTFHPDGSWSYTHRRIRSARKSIKRHLPYLFTYKNYPELKIPNTTNDIESMNSKIKDLLRTHRGYSKKLRNKIIDEILSKN